MRTVALALVLGLLGAGTASAATRPHTQARHSAKKHHRAVRHAKAKTRHGGVKHAAGDQLMKPSFA